MYIERSLNPNDRPTAQSTGIPCDRKKRKHPSLVLHRHMKLDLPQSTRPVPEPSRYGHRNQFAELDR